MTNILAVALQSMHQDSVRLEKVGMNLANALTTGYKREVVSVRPTPYSQLGGSFTAQVDALSLQADATGGTLQTQTDFHPGTLKSTGQNLDLALAGDGFFEVATASGPAYTRQGSFHLDGQGRLVNAQGYPVMGKAGAIFLSTPNPSIDSRGYVFEGPKSGAAGFAANRASGQEPVAQLKVMQFETPLALQHIGEGMVASESPAAMVSDVDVQIRQGFLENSNVSSMQEMVQLMQTMRHFESMQKVATGYDEMMGTAIRKLGDLA
jgi:flagellar basal-body rod protein FlgF